jgi:integrase
MKNCKLDNTAVTRLALPEGKGDDYFFDGDLTGFALRLRMSPNGKLRRSWWAKYKSKGRDRGVKIGDAEKLTAAKAREEARKILAKAALGQDPQQEKADQRKAGPLTLRAVVRDYLDAKQVRPRTLTESTRYLTGPYFRPLHPVAISNVTRADIAARITAIGKASGHTAANRARSALSAMLAWAVGQGYLETNPCIGANRLKENAPRERVLSDPELVAIWKACEDCGTYGKVVRLIIILASRRNEIGKMCWEELDDATGVWTLPAARAKNGKELTLPLPELAFSIIRSVPRRDGVDAIFGTTDWTRPKRALDARLAGAVKPWRLHDLRRTTATKMAEAGIAAPHIIEAILNHYTGHRSGIAGVYNRAKYQNEIRVALAMWSDHLVELAEGRPRKIVPIPRRARAETAEAS